MIGEKAYLGKGCIYAVWRMIIKHAFASLGLRRLYIGILEGNTECLEAAKKLGCTEEGRWRKHSLVKGEYQDEIWFGILSYKCLKNGWFESVDDLIKAIIDFTITWNKYFAHPFNWTYRGEGLHGKVVRRFMRLLQMESPQMEIGFLTKQLVLMKNIAQNYWSQVNNKDWQQFMDLINQKEIYIRRLIVLSSKEKLIPKSNQALKDLTEILYKNLVSHTRKVESI